MRTLLATLAVLYSAAPALADFETLLSAARTENLDLVKAELAGGTDPNPPSWHDSYAPLQFAAGNGDAEMTRLLLEAGADTEYRDHNGDRALLWAAYGGTPETVLLLLDAGSPADADADPYGETPLMTASWYNHEEMVRLLLAVGADPNRRDQSSLTALHLAARTDNTSLVRMLLEAGANPNVVSESLYETPMHEAAMRSVPSVIELLASAHAVLEARNHEGFTPLHIAAAIGNGANVAALLAASADPDAPRLDGTTAILSALSSGADRPGLGAVIAALAEVTEDTHRAFSAALRRGEMSTALRLLERGADVNALDEEGRSALANSTMLPGMTMFHYLLLRGADIERFGEEALFAGVAAGNAGVVRHLLGRGFDVESRDAYRRTPLLVAVANRQVDMVRLLLDAGADRNARDQDGQGAAELLAVAELPLQMRLEHYSQSAAWRPTETLELELDGLKENRAAIVELLGLQ
jgi:ankyrin repeat protein